MFRHSHFALVSSIIDSAMSSPHSSLGRYFQRLMHIAVISLLLTSCAVSTGPTRPLQGFQLYYGERLEVLQKMAANSPHAVLVWDSRQLSAQQLKPLLANAKAQHAVTLGYISIGELDSADRHRAELAGISVNQVALEWNDKFDSWRVDVALPAWRQWVFAESDRLSAEGFTGFFLDTPDTVDRYVSNTQWTRKERGAHVRAMVELIRAIKKRHPEHFVLLNRGLNLVGEQIWMNDDGSDVEKGLQLKQYQRYNPDAVLYENAFASDDAWTKRMESDLSQIAKAGFTQVFALGYHDTMASPASFFAKAHDAGFVAAWAESSTTLHEQATINQADLPLENAK